MSRYRGWKRLTFSLFWHYFSDGYSLCGTWAAYPSDCEPTPTWEKHRNYCPRCTYEAGKMEALLAIGFEEASDEPS